MQDGDSIESVLLSSPARRPTFRNLYDGHGLVADSRVRNELVGLFIPFFVFLAVRGLR
jgi:hypothetical protein